MSGGRDELKFLSRNSICVGRGLDGSGGHRSVHGRGEHLDSLFDVLNTSGVLFLLRRRDPGGGAGVSSSEEEEDSWDAGWQELCPFSPRREQPQLDAVLLRPEAPHRTIIVRRPPQITSVEWSRGIRGRSPESIFRTKMSDRSSICAHDDGPPLPSKNRAPLQQPSWCRSSSVIAGTVGASGVSSSVPPAPRTVCTVTIVYSTTTARF